MKALLYLEELELGPLCPEVFSTYGFQKFLLDILVVYMSQREVGIHIIGKHLIPNLEVIKLKTFSSLKKKQQTLGKP